MLEARHGEEVVAVGGLPDVHQTRQFLAMVPQVARADLEAPRRPVMRVTGDAQPALPPDLAEDGVGGLVGADVTLDVERDDVRVLAAAQPVLRHLGAGDDEQAIAVERPLRFRRDIGQVGLELLLAQPEPPPAERGDAPRAREQVLLYQDVIGDRDDVELAGRSVQVHHLAHRQRPVAPLRVHVEVAQQKGLVTRHQLLTSTCAVSFGR